MNKKLNSVYTTKRRYLILFIALIIIPFIQGNVKFLRYNYLWENRRKVPKPTRYLDFLNPNSDFTKQFERYFNDIFGLRDFFIRLKSQIDYTLYKTSDNIVIGKNGWFFYRHLTEEQLVQTDRVSNQALAKFFKNMEDFAIKLEKQGTQLVILPIPLKNSVYPEYLPDTAPTRPEKTTFHRYMDFLKSQKRIQFIDVSTRLNLMKKNFPVFTQTDFHWTPQAGVEIGKELIHLLGKLSGTQVQWSHSVSYEHIKNWNEGNEGEQLAIFTRPVEDYDKLKVEDNDRFGTTHIQDSESIIDFKSNRSNGLLPATVLLGDSFSHSFLYAGYLRYFSEFQKRPRMILDGETFAITQGKRFLIIEHLELILELFAYKDLG